MSARLLMIALDGADSRRLDCWSACGKLPNLATLRQGGLTKTLAAAAGRTDDSLWASFHYAADEAEHGRYNYRTPSSSGKLVMAFVNERSRDSFWHGLGAKGQRVAVFDLPKCREPSALNGLHLADWLVHGRYFGTPQSYPESLAVEVLARFGPPPPSRCGYHQPILDDGDVREITGNLRASVAKKRAAALHYLAAEPWDLFIVGFKEAHCAGHGLWNFVDRDHPEFDEARSARLGWPVQQIFQDIDAAIGDLVAAAGPRAEIVVFSTTQIIPNGGFNHLLPDIVERLNLVLSEPPANRLLRALHRVRRRKGPCQIMPFSDNCGALRLSTATAGPKARALTIRRIEEIFLGLTDAETGTGVVEQITYPSSERNGTRAASLPDILVHYRKKLFPRAVVSPRLGRIEAKHDRARPGNHAMGGLVIAHGPTVASAGATLTALQDFGPFAASVLGVAN